MFFFLRHGETEWGRERINQGALDSPLTERGKQQVLKVKRILENHIDLNDPNLNVYVSPSERTLETYKMIFSGLNNNLIIETKVRAVSLGVWDGTSYYELLNKGLIEDVYDWQFKTPYGEPFLSVKKRINDWFNELNEPAIVISHGLIGRVLFGEFLKADYETTLKIHIGHDVAYKFENGNIYKID